LGRSYNLITGIGTRRQANDIIYSAKTCKVVGAKIIMLYLIPDR